MTPSERREVALQGSDNDLVICPNCVHQFRAIPVNVQDEVAALKHDIERHIQIAADLAQDNEELRKDADKWFLLLSDVVLTVPASFDGEDAVRHAKCLNIAFKAILDRGQAAIDAAMKEGK